MILIYPSIHADQISQDFTTCCSRVVSSVLPQKIEITRNSVGVTNKCGKEY